MATNNTNKKNVVREQPIKKKKHGCRNCLLTLLVFVVVINVAAFFVGDYFAKKYINMGVVDCVKVLWDVRMVNEKKIVTNAYSDADYDGFNKSIKEALFLKETADLDVNELIDSIVNKSDGETGDPAGGETGDTIEKTDENAQLLARAIVRLAAAEGGSLDDILASVFTDENIDKTRIIEYDSSKYDTDYVLKLTDRQLAAVGNRFIMQTLASSSIAETIAQYGIDDIASVLKLDQLILQTDDGIAGVTVTVSLDIRTVANGAVKNAVGKDLSFAVNALLPKKVYVTAKMPLSGEGECTVLLNNTDDEKMQRIYDLVTNVTTLMGSPVNLKQTINDMFTQQFGPILGQLNDYIPAENISNHNISWDVLGTMLDMTVNTDPDKEGVTGSELLTAMNYVVSSDAEKAINTDHAFENQYYSQLEDKIVYKPADTTGLTLVDYKQEFMNELACKYMLKLERADGTPITFEDMMSLFGIGGEATDLELLDLFDPSRLDEVTGLPDADKKVKINDRMLGAIFASQVDSLTTEGTLKTMNPQVKFVILRTENGTHKVLEAGLEVDLASLLGEKVSGLGGIMTALVGEKIVLSVSVDITPDIAEADYLPTTVCYNDLSDEKTAEMLETISKFGVDLNIESLFSQINQPIRDTIAKMSDVLPIVLCDSTIDLDATKATLPPAIELPTVFETVDTMLFPNDEKMTEIDPDDKINPESIEQVLSGVSDGYSHADNAAANYDSFIDSVNKNYYMKANGGQTTKFDDLFGAGGAIDVSSFDADNFNFNGENGLFYDTTAAADLRPVFSDDELAHLMMEKMGGESGIYGDLMGIVELTVSADGTIKLVIEIEAANFMGAENKDKISLLPADRIYLVATVDTAHTADYDSVTGQPWDSAWDGVTDGSHTKKTAYRTEISINSMSDDAYETMMRMMKYLNGGSAGVALDKTTREFDLGGIVYEQLSNLQAKLGEVTLVDGGIELPSFYSFLRSALSLAPETDEADIQAALQGLMEKKDGIQNANNYDVSNIVFNEIGTPDTVDSLTLTDRQVGAALVAAGVNSNGFELLQVNIVAKDDVAHRERLKGRFVLDDAAEYMEFTFVMNLTGKTAGGKFDSVLPEHMYVTIVLAHKDADFVNLGFVVNDMTTAAQNVLFDMTNINTDSIGEKINDVTDKLAGYKGGTFEKAGAGETGFIGKVTIANPLG